MVTEIRDVGLLDKVTRHRDWTVIHEDGRIYGKSQSQQHPLPEEVMPNLESHIGDGESKVTVGGELAHSIEFGCKASAFVSVSVTCSSNSADIQAVHDILQPWVQKLTSEDLAKMKTERDAHMMHPPAGKVANPPKPTAPKALPAKPVATPPNFRR
jgi:hypothetical protein